MGFDVLKNISIKKVKHWIRKDLNQKFIEVVQFMGFDVQIKSLLKLSTN